MLAGEPFYRERRSQLADDEVRHATRQDRPHLPRHLVPDLADADAELEELLHSLMETRPLVAVLIVAGVEKRPTATAGLLELVGELGQHRLDLGLVALETLGMKFNVPDDTFGLDVVVGVLAVSEETVGEDGVDPFGVENSLRAHCFVSFSVEVGNVLVLSHDSSKSKSGAILAYGPVNYNSVIDILKTQRT